MQRMLITPSRSQKLYFRYLDSIHAALVEGLVETGIPGELIVGRTAHPWTFACLGWTRRGGQRFVSKLIVSSPSEIISEGLKKIDPANIKKASVNGDLIDLHGANIHHDNHIPLHGTQELCVVFPGRFALALPKKICSKTKYARSSSDIDFTEAIKAGLDRRAGRTLDLQITIDPLSLAIEGTAIPVALRKSGKQRILVPTFNMPVTLRGNPDDIMWAFHAGFGAKTRQGLGCPTLTK
ncbi:MAG: hypothetical protein OXF20_06885 [Gammaproteobacteria bacterium]|nr:hypothetical protein [Gammaproteobacteria bacterium]